jgi:hypothetical protein
MVFIMKIYFAGHLANKGDEIKYVMKTIIDENIQNKSINRLFSYWYLKKCNIERDGFYTYCGDNEMKIYLAGGECTSWFESITKYGEGKSLLSYFYLKNNGVDEWCLDIAKEIKTDIFLDSGAFSAWTRNVKIDIDEYCEFIHKHKKYLTVYACLDSIGDWKTTLKNQKYMEKKGLSPIWVYHYSQRGTNEEPYSLLRDMIQKYDYIALGGMAGKGNSKDDVFRHLGRCFDIISQYWPKKVHGFGVTAPDVLKEFPFYSADSTSWIGGSSRSEASFYSMGNMDTIYVGDKANLLIKTASLLDFPNDKRWFDRVSNNAREWGEFERFLTKLWEERGVSFDGSKKKGA